MGLPSRSCSVYSAAVAPLIGITIDSVFHESIRQSGASPSTRISISRKINRHHPSVSALHFCTIAPACLSIHIYQYFSPLHAMSMSKMKAMRCGNIVDSQQQEEKKEDRVESMVYVGLESRWKEM